MMNKNCWVTFIKIISITAKNVYKTRNYKEFFDFFLYKSKHKTNTSFIKNPVA